MESITFTPSETLTLQAALEIILRKTPAIKILQEEEQGTEVSLSPRAARKGHIKKSVASNRARKFYKQK